jgi:NAD(P)H-hydrate epimerase
MISHGLINALRKRYFNSSMRFVSSAEARAIDECLINDYQYTIEQLIEAAGLSIFHVLRPYIPVEWKILIVSGPGNNGGDGLVLARYLHKAGYNVHGHIPWELKKDHLVRLYRQCTAFGVPFKGNNDAFAARYDMIIDAIYGFGFRPPLQEDAVCLLRQIEECGKQIVSIDVPSGWNVDSDVQDDSIILKPDILISMTAPKLCARDFKGKAHLLVDSFVPNQLLQ